MKVILTEDIPRLGAKGELVNIKDGYGRNYLIPSGKALLATAANLAHLETRMKKEEARVRKDKAEAERLAERLSGVSCTIRVQADEGDKLYGSVGPRDISQSLSDQGIEIDPQNILMDEHIKMLGVYPVEVELFKDVRGEIKVWIIRE